MTAVWNPLGLPEVDAETAKGRIEILEKAGGYAVSIEDRSVADGRKADHGGDYPLANPSRPFLVVTDTEAGHSLGGELIAEGDVDAVRAMLTT
ncbi:MAG: hypothetical protein IH994_04045 [Proteobacteria bacterium]|nr:hypothetical protein [Pseudomonadota bacterium]